MTSGFLDKLLARLDRVSPEEVQGYLLRLVREKGFFERVFEALEEGVIICDPNGQITFINRAACGFFGADHDAAVGRRLPDIVRGLDWQRMIAGRQSVSRDLEVFYPENRYLNFYLSPIEDVEVPDDGSPAALGYVMLVRDITQTRKLTQEMLESERMSTLSTLAAGVAHEIGNPLNSLNIHLQLLERKLKKHDRAAFNKVHEQIDIARAEVQRLHFIIDQFLGAMRPSNPNFDLLDINKIVEGAVNFLAPEIKDRRIQTLLQLTPGLPLLRVDETMMKQALYNLIKNACQAVNAGGQIVLRTELTEYEVRIVIKDSGKGMSPETLGQMFEAYFTTKKTGTGLGMMIVRRIIRDHGGELSVESQEGVGTTITIHFPRGARPARFLGSGEQAAETPAAVIDV